jgi:hypothetical protein
MDRLKQLPASFVFMSAAVILYGLFGSPTPDNPGLLEMIIGGLLALSIATAGIGGMIDLWLERTIFLKSLQILFLCGLILPSLSAVYYGNDMMLILRDVLAFAFLGLPLFLSEKFAAHENVSKILAGLFVFAGIAFALRTLMPIFNVWIAPDELLYLSNSPLALFAAAFLAGLLWESLQNPNRNSLLLAAGCLAGLAILCAAMLLDVQRATIGAVFLTVFILAALSFIETPRRAALPILILATCAALLYPLVNDALQAMAQKTASVGFNMRSQEAMAVFDALSSSPETLFIGRGWGSVFASPAVGGLDVNYTHSFLTTMALKGGLVMLGLAILTVLAGLYEIFLIFQRDRVRGLSLFWPLIIPALLYASHKSLDFGLLLLLIGVWSTNLQTLRTGAPSVKTEEHL